MLLGHYVSDLLSLLRERNQVHSDTVVSPDVVAVMTRAQLHQVEQSDSEQRSLAPPSTVDKDVVKTHSANVGADFDNELFEGGRTCVHLTRRQKWER